MNEVTVVPALPGFTALRYWTDCVEAQPIIAWRIGSSYPVPITVNGIDDQSSIELPDGRVHDVGYRTFDTRAEWIADCAEAEARKPKPAHANRLGMPVKDSASEARGHRLGRH